MRGFSFFQNTRRWLKISLAGILAISLIFSPVAGYAQTALNLPTPGTMVTLSPVYNPAVITGLTVYPDNPLQFDFIIDIGDDHLKGEALKIESQKLINYFMATLTVPEDEMWVNLSPYEEDRIIAEGLSHTAMGRDMLAQDYLLKQLTASLMYPEDEFGKTFWDRIYKKATERYGTAEIPTNTFNKIWIVPDEAVVYVNGTNVFIVENHLKVMLEEDYLALESNQGSTKHGLGNVTNEDLDTLSGISAEIVREVLIPEIEREVNTGKNFANLRQMYNSMLLATWYKKNLKESLLGQIYADKNKTDGIEIADKNVKQEIYGQYLKAFEKGVYNYIREDIDAVTREVIPRKYFSGGLEHHRNIAEAHGAVPAKLIAKAARPYVVTRMRGDILGENAASSPLQHLTDIVPPGWRTVPGIENRILVNDQGKIRYAQGAEPIHLLAKRLVGTRHGRTNANRFRLLNGQGNDAYLDSLNEEGELMADQMADELIEQYGVDFLSGDVVVITSGLDRTGQSVQPLKQKVKDLFGVDLVIESDEDLNEMDFGDATHVPYTTPPGEVHEEMRRLGIEPAPMEGPLNDIRKRIWPGRNQSGDVSAHFPNGESYLDLLSRQIRFLRRIQNKYAGKTVILSGHAIQMSALRVVMEANAIEEAGVVQWQQMELRNAQIMELKAASSPILILNKAEKQIKAAVDELESTEAVWFIKQLMWEETPMEDLQISGHAQEALRRAFGLSMPEIEALIKDNNTYHILSPFTWAPGIRRITINNNIVTPKYRQLLFSDLEKLTGFIENSRDAETVGLLADMLGRQRKGDVEQILGTASGRRLLAQLGPVFQTQNMDDLTIIVTNLMSLVREIDDQLSDLRAKAQQKAEENSRRLWNEKRVEDMGAYDQKLTGAATTSDWGKYTQTLVDAITDGTLTDAAYLNYYLQNSALMSRSQEKNYQSVRKAGLERGLEGIALNERMDSYKRAREAAVNSIGKASEYRGEAVIARALLGLNEQNSPDLTNEQRRELYKKARKEVVAGIGNTNNSFQDEAVIAGVILSLNEQNSPDLTDEQRKELFKRAREEVLAGIGNTNNSYQDEATIARFVFSLNERNSPDLSDQQRQRFYKRAREAVVDSIGKTGDFEVEAAIAGIVLGLNEKNSPDLTDEQRIKLYRRVREEVVPGINHGHYHEGDAMIARVVLSLNEENSPDLTNAQREELYKSARETVVAGIDHGRHSEGDAIIASVVFSLNRRNSPDLSDEQREELYRKARETVIAGINHAHTHPGEGIIAQVLLSPANMILDLVDGSMMTWTDLDSAASDLSTHDSWNDDLIPGVPNEMLAMGAIMFASGMFDNDLGSMGMGGSGIGTGLDGFGGMDMGGGMSFDANDIGSDAGGMDSGMSGFGMGSSPVQDRSNSEVPGGIDFNANNVRWDERGDKINITVPTIDLKAIESGTFNGIAPVIINITPLPSLMPLLGLSTQINEDKTT